jgi:8-oxo-dGTP diphosphatase
MDAETEKKEYKYRYPHPAVTADCVVFAFGSDGLEVLLVERGHEPCKGMWAFPGGFLNMDETAEECAKRELREETGLTLDDVHEIGSFSAVHRDPRERVISIAFYALARNTAVKGGDDAAEARWWAVDSLPPLAFDHDDMLRRALKRLRQDLLLEPELFDGQLPAALSFLI